MWKNKHYNWADYSFFFPSVQSVLTAQYNLIFKKNLYQNN